MNASAPIIKSPGRDPIPSNECQYATRGNSFFQAKLTINNPNDEHEKEADAVADKVMRMEAPFIQAKPIPILPVQRKCAHCEEEEKKMQRKEINASESSADNNLENYVSNIKGSGSLLPGEVRNFYEPRFGYDFSNVRVHTDSVAAKSAQSINALAYTTGNNIVFNAGQYSPQTDSGKRLLGHELTHVVQQGSASASTGAIQKMNTDEEDLMRKPLPSDPVLQLHSLKQGSIQRQVNPSAAITSAAPAPHARANTALSRMMHYKNNEKILFDWWANDCRDNDRDGASDLADPTEGGSSDGDHYHRTYPGYIVQPGVTCTTRTGGFYTTRVRVDITDTVKYRVCADLISQAWTDAGVPMGHRRSVVSIIDYIRHNRHWRWWPIASFTGPYIAGDLLFSRHGGEGHATMVIKAALASADPTVIHLPGQTQLINTGQYRPHIPNDIQIQPWWPGRHKYGVGRYIG